MITALHAGWGEGVLVLWGERILEIDTGRPPRRARSADRAREGGRPHPFAATASELVRAVADLARAEPDEAIPEERTVVWLPTAGRRPFPSSALVGEVPVSRARATLEPWSVPHLRLDVALAVDLLLHVQERATAPGGAVVVGTDLAFWAELVQVALRMVARQRFLPALQVSDGAHRAAWRAVLAPEDRTRLAALAARMPPAARACIAAPRRGTRLAPPDTPAWEAIEAFLNDVIDHCVRTLQPETRAKARASLHDAWIEALVASDPTLEARDVDLEGLRRQIEVWSAPLATTLASPYRLCFRLEEPAQPEEDAGAPGRRRRAPAPRDWYVRFLVQPVDDPSLQVPAAEIWRARGRARAALRRGTADARAFLLVALGQAASLCPRIEATLTEATPEGYALDAAEAHVFLTERALRLEQAGFGVLLPAWWTGRDSAARISLRAHVREPKLRTEGGLDLRRIVSFDWQVALDGDPLTLHELEELARLKAPLVQMRGKWVELRADEVRAAIAFLEQRPVETTSLAEVIRMALGAQVPALGVAFGGVYAKGSIREILDRLEGRASFVLHAPPDSFAGVLRPYQARGYAWLAFLRELGLGACLADDMGLGKTVQTLALVLRERERGEVRPVLLVCPTSVVANWQREAARFAPKLEVLVHHGVERKKGASFVRQATRHALVISSYALLVRDLAHLRAVDWAGVVLDEAQNIKNAETKQAQAARALGAGYRIALTGTPVENHVGDLWSIMEFLNPDLLGTREAFRRRFLLPIQLRRDPHAIEQLRRITAPLILRRTKSDREIVAELPEKLEMKVYCTLTREQASLYRAITREAEQKLARASGIQRKGLILATLSKLKQVCNHPAQLLRDGSAIAGRSGKLARLSEMLEEVLAVRDRALLFTQFTEMGEILKRHLQEVTGREVLFLHGAVPKRQRDAMVERFQTPEGPPIFLLSLKAGGTGLNLTRASHVFHFDRWWNPAVENQATDRAFRIGQTRDVQVHKLVCAGTCEEAIDEMIERKKSVADQVVGSGEAWLTELSTAELRKVFELRAEAVGD